jgi:hypothetical protein
VAVRPEFVQGRGIPLLVGRERTVAADNLPLPSEASAGRVGALAALRGIDWGYGGRQRQSVAGVLDPL